MIIDLSIFVRTKNCSYTVYIVYISMGKATMLRIWAFVYIVYVEYWTKEYSTSSVGSVLYFTTISRQGQPRRSPAQCVTSADPFQERKTSQTLFLCGCI